MSQTCIETCMYSAVGDHGDWATKQDTAAPEVVIYLYQQNNFTIGYSEIEQKSRRFWSPSFMHMHVNSMLPDDPVIQVYVYPYRVRILTPYWTCPKKFRYET